MTTLPMIAAKFALTALLAGSLVGGASAVAGAAQGSGNGTLHGHHVAGSERARMCQRQVRGLALSARRQAKFAAGTATFVGLEAKATHAGDTRLAAYWAKVVARRDAYAGRNHARLAKRTARHATRCG